MKENLPVMKKGAHKGKHLKHMGKIVENRTIGNFFYQRWALASFLKVRFRYFSLFISMVGSPYFATFETLNHSWVSNCNTVAPAMSVETKRKRLPGSRTPSPRGGGDERRKRLPGSRTPSPRGGGEKERYPFIIVDQSETLYSRIGILLYTEVVPYHPTPLGYRLCIAARIWIVRVDHTRQNQDSVQSRKVGGGYLCPKWTADRSVEMFECFVSLKKLAASPTVSELANR